MTTVKTTYEVPMRVSRTTPSKVKGGRVVAATEDMALRGVEGVDRRCECRGSLGKDEVDGEKETASRRERQRGNSRVRPALARLFAPRPLHNRHAYVPVVVWECNRVPCCVDDRYVH